MLARFRNLLKAPTFDTPEKSIQAQNINTILLFTLALTFVYFLYALFFPPPGQFIIAIVAVILELGLLSLLHSGHIRLASFLFNSLLWLVILLEEILYGGVRDSGFASFAIVILAAGLTMGIQSGITFTVLTVFAGVGLIYAETRGWLAIQAYVSTSSVLLSHTITFTAVLLLLFLAIRSITASSKRILEDEQESHATNIQLEESRSLLQGRTVALEQRNILLQTVIEAARLASQVKDEIALLEQTIQLLVDHLELDHVGIYLASENEEFAVLKATNSPEGIALLASEYQLAIIHGDIGLTYAPIDRLHYKAGEQQFYLERPIQLSDTKTNSSFPLLFGERIIGLINIQTLSPDPQYIDQQILQTFADQVSLSIVNIRLVGQLQNRIKEIDQLAAKTTKSAWEQIKSGGTLGYHYDQLQVLPVTETFPFDTNQQLLAGNSTAYSTTDKNPRSRLIAPIILRGNVIGIIGYENKNPQYEWLADEITLLETIASRVSLAFENTRLVSDAQMRAERERAIGQAATRMRETLDIDVVLQTAVQEIRNSLGLKLAEVRLQNSIKPETHKRAKDKGAGK